jgi:hypothetical protein
VTRQFALVENVASGYPKVTGLIAKTLTAAEVKQKRPLDAKVRAVGRELQSRLRASVVQGRETGGGWMGSVGQVIPGQHEYGLRAGQKILFLTFAAG